MDRLVELLPVPTGDAVLGLVSRLRDALTGHGPALLPVPAGDHPVTERLASALGAGRPLHPGEDDQTDPTALVIATSGSAGEPKGVLLQASALAASAEGTEQRLGGSGQWLLALPAQHIAGMQVLLRAARAGTEPVVVDVAEPFTARAFLDAADRMTGARQYVSLVPTQLRRILADTDATTALAAFAAVLVGGAATAPDLLDRARAAGIAVVTSYGMSETCGGCVYDGLPLPGVRVEIEPDPTPFAASPGAAAQIALSAREPGRVLLSGPVIARGYRGRPGDPSFGARNSNRDKFFRTADLGRLDRGDRLEILGRMDDVIVTGGTNVAPQAVESVLSAQPGVAEAVVVGVPDPDWGQRVVAVVVAESADRVLELGALRDAVARALGPAAAPRELHLVPAIPLRGPGKPDRRAVRALAEARD